MSDKYNTPRFSREGGLFVGVGVVYDDGGEGGGGRGCAR